jgi:hypothetical protein
MVKERFELASLLPTSLSEEKKQVKVVGLQWQAHSIPFPLAYSFTCTEIIKLTRGGGGWNAETIAFRK